MNFLVILSISIGIIHLSNGEGHFHFGIDRCVMMNVADTADRRMIHITLEPEDAWERASVEIKDAGKICQIDLETQISTDDHPCTEFSSYGIGNQNHDTIKAPTTVWAENGCKGIFRIHYLPGQCEHIHIGSKKICDNGNATCPEQMVSKSMGGKILGMYMENGDEGVTPCQDGREKGEDGHDSWTYGWTEEKATVRDGCASDWFICHDNAKK